MDESLEVFDPNILHLEPEGCSVDTTSLPGNHPNNLIRLDSDNGYYCSYDKNVLTIKQKTFSFKHNLPHLPAEPCPH